MAFVLGFDSTGGPVFYGSNDLVHWAPSGTLPINPMFSQRVCKVVGGNGVLLALLGSKPGYGHTISSFKSFDGGVTWTNLYSIYPLGYEVIDIGYSNDTFFLLTCKGSTGDTVIIMSSTDGVSWSSSAAFSETSGAQPLTSPQFWQIVYFQSAFHGIIQFISGGTGYLHVYSADGVHWSAADIPSLFGLTAYFDTYEGIAAGETKVLLLMDDSKTVYTSTDFVTFTPLKAGFAFLPDTISDTYGVWFIGGSYYTCFEPGHALFPAYNGIYLNEYDRTDFSLAQIRGAVETSEGSFYSVNWLKYLSPSSGPLDGNAKNLYTTEDGGLSWSTNSTGIGDGTSLRNLIDVIAPQPVSDLRYWVAPSASVFSDINSWSSTSGGVGGESAPSASNNVFFDLNGPGDCTLDMSVDISTFSSQTYAGTISQNSNSVTIESDATFAGGTFQGYGPDIYINGNVNLWGGFIHTPNNKIIVYGDVSCGPAFGAWGRGNDSTISLESDSDQHLITSGGILPSLLIDKASGQAKVFGDTSTLFINGDLLINSGTMHTNERDIIVGSVGSDVGYYVDLAVLGTGHVGSTADPFSWDDLINTVNSGTSAVFFIRGQATVSSWFNTDNVSELQFLAWNPSLYGPFRIDYELDNIWLHGIWENCIINTTHNGILLGTSFTPKPVIIRSSILISLGINICYASSLQIEGCTIVTGEINAIIEGNDANFVDSVLAASWPGYSYESLTVNLTNCACTFSESDVPGLNINFHNQFSWTAPTWPSWDDPQALWNKNNILIGVNSPPSPGNAPYVGYETDPWGYPRNDIGAVSDT
jgi:hypothetical protein